MNSPTLKTTATNSLPAQLQQIGLRALPATVDDFLARATKARWSPHQILEQMAQAEIAERSRRSLERRLRRSERRPIILTTNRPFKEWNEVFPNATCIVTLLDRLLHHADVTVIEGDSYRVRESEQETAARRRKK
jgi:DNA replication protein DnaC